jgi:hypothetical protein
MGWAELRAAARATVHEQFGLPATYTAPDVGAVALPITVRWHTKTVRHGDLDREGYAQQLEDVNRVLFDRTQVTPARNGVLVLEGSTYYVDFLLPAEGTQFIPADVVRVRE